MNSLLDFFHSIPGRMRALMMLPEVVLDDPADSAALDKWLHAEQVRLITVAGMLMLTMFTAGLVAALVYALFNAAVWQAWVMLATIGFCTVLIYRAIWPNREQNPRRARVYLLVAATLTSLMAGLLFQGMLPLMLVLMLFITMFAGIVLPLRQAVWVTLGVFALGGVATLVPLPALKAPINLAETPYRHVLTFTVFGVVMLQVLHLVTVNRRRATRGLEQLYAQARAMEAINSQLENEVVERIQTEAVLAENEARLRLLLETAPDGIALMDRNGVILNANQALADLIGYEHETLLGRPFHEFIRGEARQEKAARMLIELMERGKMSAREMHIITPAGEFRVVEQTSAMVEDERGEPAFFVNVLRDISERKAAEQHQMALTLEKERVQILGELIQAVSHEFRTPLSVVGTNVYLLKKTAADDLTEERLDVIREQADYIGELVDSMLTMVRLDTQHVFASAPVDINSLIRQTVAGQRVQAEAAQVQFTVALAERLPTVPGDARELHRVIHALLENALHFTPEGGHVRLGTWRDNDAVCFSVADTGIGIPEAEQSRIFEPFYRPDAARSARRVGLGLAMASRIVQAHRGEIDVESAPGVGSTFTVRLPVGEESGG